MVGEQDHLVSDHRVPISYINFLSEEKIILIIMSYKSFVDWQPRPIERCLDSAFHKTGLILWAGQNFLAAQVVLLNG